MARPIEPLPIDSVFPEIEREWQTHPNLVLEAPTGAGKTTRFPPWLARAEWAPPGQILLLEPRRIAARAAAKRIAQESGQALGEFVGYHVRFDRRATDRTRIVAMTPGMFLRRLQSDPFLSGVGAVLFDEFHERQLDADLSLALARRVQLEVRDDLRIAAFSATLEVEPLARFLGDAPRVVSLGRLFPVECRYRDYSLQRPLAEQVADAVRDVADQRSGDLLAFLPGVREIEATRRQLEAWSRREAVDLRPLFGDLSAADQDAALRSGARRRVVIATNVAESSVTVGGITAVVDSGWVRFKRFDSGAALDRLELGRISQASAEQRAGRAGREQPGVCVRLWSRREHDLLEKKSVPEIARTDVSGAVLQLLGWGESPTEFPWFEPPPPESIERAQRLLQALGAVEFSLPADPTSTLRVTSIGRAMIEIPAAPRIARLLLESSRSGHVDRVCLLAAALSERSGFARGDGRDLRVQLNALESDLRQRPKDHWSLARVRDQFRKSVRSALDSHDLKLSRSKATGGAGVEVDDVIRRALLAAFPDRVARRRDEARQRAVMVGGKGILLSEADSSVSSTSELLVVCDVIPPPRNRARGEARAQTYVDVDRDWLDPELVETSREVFYDRDRESVAVRVIERYLDLTLSEGRAAPNRGGEEGSAASRLLGSIASAGPARSLPLEDAEVRQFLLRIETLRRHCPELEFESIDLAEVAASQAVGEWRMADVRKKPLLPVLLGRFSYSDQQLMEREAPARITVPSGRSVSLEYRPDGAPILAARIQELFGLAESPRLARGRVRVLLHLLAPNGRPQQVTDDLESFWSRTYFEVRKDLRRRYPKHDWPEDPTTATASRRPQRRRRPQ